MANRAPFSSADFRAMEPADLHYGRGRRESQVTERMQEFREYQISFAYNYIDYSVGKDITRKVK